MDQRHRIFRGKVVEFHAQPAEPVAPAAARQRQRHRRLGDGASVVADQRSADASDARGRRGPTIAARRRGAAAARPALPVPAVRHCEGGDKALRGPVRPARASSGGSPAISSSAMSITSPRSMAAISARSSSVRRVPSSRKKSAMATASRSRPARGRAGSTGRSAADAASGHSTGIMPIVIKQIGLTRGQSRSTLPSAENAGR